MAKHEMVGLPQNYLICLNNYAFLFEPKALQESFKKQKNI